MNHLNEQQIEDRLKALEDNQVKILEVLTPISDVYRSATTIGKWFTGFLVFLSVGLGILLAIKQLRNP